MIKVFLQLKQPCNIYFCLLCLKMLQGTAYPKGSLPSLTLTFIFMFWALIGTIDIIRNYPLTKYFKALNLLCLMYAVYILVFWIVDGGVFHDCYGDEKGVLDALKAPCYSLLPIYLFYLYTLKGYLNLKLLKTWMPILFVFGVISFFSDYREQLERYTMMMGSSNAEVTSNAGYSIMYFIPGMLVFQRNKSFVLLGMLLCLIVVLISVKRGAILIAVLAVLFVLWQTLKFSKGKYKLMALLLVLSFLVAGFMFWDYMMESSEHFSNRLAETLDGESSGRDSIFKYFWNSFIHETNSAYQLFGRGTYGTLRIYHLVAHNDWLEILTNQGLLGIAIFTNYWVKFFKDINRKVGMDNICLLLIFGMTLMQTFFSMSICGMPQQLTLMIGFCMANGFQRSNKVGKYA